MREREETGELPVQGDRKIYRQKPRSSIFPCVWTKQVRKLGVVVENSCPALAFTAAESNKCPRVSLTRYNSSLEANIGICDIYHHEIIINLKMIVPKMKILILIIIMMTIYFPKKHPKTVRGQPSWRPNPNILDASCIIRFRTFRIILDTSNIEWAATLCKCVWWISLQNDKLTLSA